jgi:hypothetical protein
MYKTMILAYADVIKAAEFLLGPAEPPEDIAAKATWNKKKVNIRFQLLRSLEITVTTSIVSRPIILRSDQKTKII